MSLARSPRALLAVLLALAGCAEEPTGPSVPEESGPTGDLVLSIPPVTAAHLVAKDSATSGRTPGPRRADEVPELEGVFANDEAEDYLDEVASIYEPRTLVGIGPELSYAWGDHRYQGNKGRVTTTARVTYNGSPLGSQTATMEDYGLFLIDGPRVKYISVIAQVYADQECGLSLSGSTRHEAWWEWFLGVGVATWGRSERPSSAGPESQDPCPESPTSWGGYPFGTLGAVCWVSIDYDLDTGEILDVHVLYCTGLDEEEGG